MAGAGAGRGVAARGGHRAQYPVGTAVRPAGPSYARAAHATRHDTARRGPTPTRHEATSGRAGCLSVSDTGPRRPRGAIRKGRVLYPVSFLYSSSAPHR